MSMRIAVFASGGGSNLQALIDHFNGTHQSGARIALVIADRACAALERADAAGIERSLIPVRGADPDELALATLAALEGAAIDVVALAGYLQLVPAPVVERFRGRIVNVHPALLPAFGGPGMYGRRVHEAVIRAGVRVSGATVHHVDEEYDRGRPIAQWPVPVLPDDSPEALAARVLRVEHWLYPIAIERLVHELSGAAPLPQPEFQFAAAALDQPAIETMRAAFGLPKEE
jgi:formyltetrahydrofolate-dependent phosphoribosylglycinamide formyltransferase